MFVHLGDRRTMASFARFGCRFVEEDQVLAYWLFERVARRTRDVFVSSLERESRLFVIKERRLPLIAVVASGAIVDPCAKLVPMWILVTIAAFDGCFREIHLAHVELHGGRLMAVDAGHCAMRAFQREVRLRMVEVP